MVEVLQAHTLDLLERLLRNVYVHSRLDGTPKCPSCGFSGLVVDGLYERPAVSQTSQIIQT